MQAYWLGFIYADGWITSEGNIYRIGMKVGIVNEDENGEDLEAKHQILNFIEALGLNDRYIHSYSEEQEIDGRLYNVRYYRIIFANQKMARDLLNLGVHERKSNIIRLPHFNSPKLYLAFLLGYFDGDGETGTSRVYSGSWEFLNDIRQLFKIDRDIKIKRSKLGSAWALSLEPEVFNAMLDAYPDSMEKKRNYLQA